MAGGGIPKMPRYDLDFATSGKVYQLPGGVTSRGYIPILYSLAGTPCMQVLSLPHVGINGLGSFDEIR